MAPEPHAHAIEGIPSAYAKIMMTAHQAVVSKDAQRSIIRLLTLEIFLGREIHMRMYTVCGAQNVITKSTVNQWV